MKESLEVLVACSDQAKSAFLRACCAVALGTFLMMPGLASAQYDEVGGTLGELVDFTGIIAAFALLMGAIITGVIGFRASVIGVKAFLGWLRSAGK